MNGNIHFLFIFSVIFQMFNGSISLGFEMFQGLEELCLNGSPERYQWIENC